MSVIDAVLSGLAGMSFALLLLGVAGALFSVGSLIRLRQHYRVVEAAERMEGVSLNYVVRRYVPRKLRTHRRVEEMQLAKQFIDARRPGWKLWAMASAALVVCSGIATVFFAHLNLRAAPATEVAARSSMRGDALTMIRGVWGWRADFAQSCAENPQSISVSPDHKKLLVHYAKPLATGSDFNFDIVSTQSDTIVLEAADPAGVPRAHPVQVSIKFLNENEYVANNNGRQMVTTGVIERCR